MDERTLHFLLSCASVGLAGLSLWLSRKDRAREIVKETTQEYNARISSLENLLRVAAADNVRLTAQNAELVAAKVELVNKLLHERKAE